MALIGGYNQVTGSSQTNPLPVLNTWTTSVWINIPASTLTSGASAPILSTCWNGGGNANGLGLWYNPNEMGTGQGGFGSVVLNDAANNWIVNKGISDPLQPNTWYMVTETVTAGHVDLYVNGSLVDAQATNASLTPLFCEPTQDLDLGYGPAGWGAVTEQSFQLYDSVLSASQVQALYHWAGTSFMGTVPAGSPVEIGTGGTFDLAGYSQSILTLANFNGSGGTVTNSGVTPATLTLTPSAGTNKFSGVISNGAGQTALTINGDSGAIVQLDGRSTFSGPTTVQTGTLSGTGAVSNSVVTIAAGTALAPGDNAPGNQSGGFGTFTVGGLTLADNSQLVFDITSASSDLVVVNGALALGNNLTLNVVDGVDGGGLPNGQYPLITYGSITGLTPSTFTVSGVPGGDIVSVASVTSGGTKELVLELTRLDVWTGAVSTAWNTTDANWTTGTYGDGDMAQFDDSSAGTAVTPGSVTIAGTVRPLSILVNNNTVPYTFSGPGTIAGTTSLVKSGTGLLVIGVNCTYTGATVINGGTLQMATIPVPLIHLAMNGTGSINNGDPIADSSGHGFNATMNGGGGASYVSPPGPSAAESTPTAG